MLIVLKDPTVICIRLFDYMYMTLSACSDELAENEVSLKASLRSSLCFTAGKFAFWFTVGALSAASR